MSEQFAFIGAQERTTSDGRRIMARPATRDRFRTANAPLTRKLRIAAYARVSTDHEEQQTSYEAQVDYYTRYITGNPEWEFAGMYADEYTPYGLNPKSPRTADFSRLFAGFFYEQISISMKLFLFSIL